MFGVVLGRIGLCFFQCYGVEALAELGQVDQLESLIQRLLVYRVVNWRGRHCDSSTAEELNDECQLHRSFISAISTD